jgi:anaerobic selenocysteine-containing dehydrogenase
MPDENKITRRKFFKDSAIVVTAGVAANGVLGSFTPAPAEAAPLPKKWDREADVIVVGSGPTGL